MDMLCGGVILVYGQSSNDHLHIEYSILTYRIFPLLRLKYTELSCIYLRHVEVPNNKGRTIAGETTSSLFKVL